MRDATLIAVFTATLEVCKMRSPFSIGYQISELSEEIAALLDELLPEGDPVGEIPLAPPGELFVFSEAVLVGGK